MRAITTQSPFYLTSVPSRELVASTLRANGYQDIKILRWYLSTPVDLWRGQLVLKCSPYAMAVNALVTRICPTYYID